jgi:hypothetical protein
MKVVKKGVITALAVAVIHRVLSKISVGMPEGAVKQLVWNDVSAGFFQYPSDSRMPEPQHIFRPMSQFVLFTERLLERLRSQLKPEDNLYARGVMQSILCTLGLSEDVYLTDDKLLALCYMCAVPSDSCMTEAELSVLLAELLEIYPEFKDRKLQVNSFLRALFSHCETEV